MIRFVIVICHDPRGELFVFLLRSLECSSFSPLILIPEKLCLLSYTFPLFLRRSSLLFCRRCLQKGHVYSVHADISISIAMRGAPLRFSQRDCHSYNSGNPIGPEHQCIPAHTHNTTCLSSSISVCSYACIFDSQCVCVSVRE